MRRGQQAHARLPVHTYQPWPTSLGCSARVCTHRGRSTCHQCSSPPARAPHSCWGECAQWRAGCGAKHSAAAGVKGARAFCPDIRRAPPRCSCADEHRQAGRHWRADRCNSGAQQPAQRRGTRTFAHAFIVHLAEDLRVAARADAAQGNALVPLGCGVAVLGGARALPRGADLEHDIRVLAACNAAARQESGAMQGGRRGRDKKRWRRPPSSDNTPCAARPLPRQSVWLAPYSQAGQRRRARKQGQLSFTDRARPVRY